MTINMILLGGALIILFGYLAEFIFRRLFIPDSLILILLGVIMGPSVLGWADPQSFGIFAPLFTTFTLIFILFEGSLYIDIKTFLKGFGSGSTVALLYYLASAIIITLILLAFNVSLFMALLGGTALGAISPAFVVPIISQMGFKKSNKNLFTILTLESAIADVLAIAFALTVMELSVLNTFSIQNVLSQILSMFAMAGMIGIAMAIIWIYLEGRFFPSDQNYMMSIAFLLITYFIAEYLHASGVIAVLFVGLVLNNSKSLIRTINKVATPGGKDKPENGALPDLVVISKREKQFYEEISFILKTFFFVYVGQLLDLSSLRVVIIGSCIVATMIITRFLILRPVKILKKSDRNFMTAIYARGLAPAALMQIAIERKVIRDEYLVQIVFFVITLSIVASSVHVFLYRKKSAAQEEK